MPTDEITIHVQPAVASGYRTASEEDRRKMNLLVSLQLGEFLQSRPTLEDAMKAMSVEAGGNGLTPEILDSILHE